MSSLAALPPELLVLPPLALAAGIDLYLTLLFLGAATTTGWWEQPLPGALGDMDSLGVLITVGSFYVLEFSAERYPAAGLVWNAFHAVIRPISGALLALLLLDGQPTSVVVGGALLAGVLASLAHAGRSGRAILRWLTSAEAPHTVLVSLLEDALVLGMIALVLDHPGWSLVAFLVLGGAGAVGAPSHVRGFVFVVRLMAGRVFQTLGQRRWTGRDDFPAWVRSALESDAMAPNAGLRGCAAAAHCLPEAPRFATGWVVVRGTSPIFVYRSLAGKPVRVDLAALVARDVHESGLFRRVDLRSDAAAAAGLFFRLDGPGQESLRAEFLLA